MTRPATRPSSKKDKLISLQMVQKLLKDYPPSVRAHEVPVGADGRPDNRVLFRHFFVRQIKLARLVVQLRFPFANYLRNEIAEALADRECKRLGIENGADDVEKKRLEVKRKYFSRALETRHDELGSHSNEQKNKDRVRTQMLRHIHGAAMKAADLFDEIEAAAACRSKHPRSYQNSEDKLTMWIINSLSCFALMEMFRLSEKEEDVPFGENEDDESRAKKIKLFREMRKAAAECAYWRNHVLTVNMGLASRHVEMQSVPGDTGSRHSHAADGLLQAVDRYNVLLPAPFEGFAPDWIRQAIKRGYQQQGSLISLPINVQQNAIKVREFQDRCLNKAGIPAGSITSAMMLKGFTYTNVETGAKEFMAGVKDAANGGVISPEALAKARALPSIRSIDAPINDHGDGEGETYPQLACGDANAAERHMEKERSSRLNRLIHRHTNSAERVVLGFMTVWSDPAIAAAEYISDLANQSTKLTVNRLEARSRKAPRANRIAKITLLESFQPAAAAPIEPPAKASGE